jgi:hypothetical protein
MTTDPYNGNRYAFAGGNPLSNIELDGHEPLPLECAGADSPDCANFYYTGKTANPNLNTDVAQNQCQWHSECITELGSLANKNDSPNRQYLAAQP